MVNRYVIGTTVCPGLRSGINSGAGRRHQPPSPKQPQPTVAREKCRAGACPQLGAACVAQTTTDPSINQCTQFSHLGVPAPAGMGNWYENEWFPLPKSSFRPLNSSFPRRRESRGEGWHQPPPNTSNDQVPFSYPGVPAAAGMDDWYENEWFPLPKSSFRPLNSSFPRRRESRGEGWHQPPPNTSNDQVPFSYLGVPAAAGMSDWFENAPTRFSSAPTNPSIRHSREGGNPEGWGEGVVTLGLVPSQHHTPSRRIPPARLVIATKMNGSRHRIGHSGDRKHAPYPDTGPESRGEGWHQPPPNTSNDQVPSSYLGVPAPAGMGDWYENAPTRFSSAPLNPSIPRSRHSGPSIRHSREGGNPEGWGEGIVALGLVPSLGRTARSRTLHRPAYHHFHPLMRPSQDHGDSGESTSRTPIRGRNPEGEGKGKTAKRRARTWQPGIFILLCGLRKTMAILAIDTVWALRLRQLAELARPHTKTTQRRGQT